MSRILRIGLPLFLATLLFAAPALAAGVPGAGISLGVKGGINVASITNIDDELGADDARTGLVAGAFVKANLGPLNLQIEGLYSQKGATGPEIMGETPAIELTYFDVPVLLRLDLPSPAFNIYLFGGPVLSFLTKAETVYGDETGDIKDELESSEFGMAIGAGLEMSKVLLELRYSAGFSTIAKDADPDMPDYKNRVISVMAGITLF